MDKKYNFAELFNDKTGFLVRSNVMLGNKMADCEPYMRSFPELIDIGIMGHCHCAEKGFCKMAGVDCYQNAPFTKRDNMPISSYKNIIDQCENRVFQVALGGAGDPNKHEQFEEILAYTRAKGIVPNFTTSGLLLTDEEAQAASVYCGAVAVSMYSRLNENGQENNPETISAIEKLIESGCSTNIHYVLSLDTISEALCRLENDLFPSGINAVVFLLYKAVGLGVKEKVITGKEEQYSNFIKQAMIRNHPYRIGFDTCQAPAIRNMSSCVCDQSLDYCEAAKFSMFIDCDLIAYPCSFGIDHREYKVSLQGAAIEDAWNSEEFDKFRIAQDVTCLSCNVVSCYKCALDLCSNICGRHIGKNEVA
ncbi:MAG: radical SAM protein [Clostridiales Family XIII bacterium]|nr:radical SAM protein [Clostridiales Family XIII bacterium]